MSSSTAPRTRSIVEVAILAALVYLVLGTPGLNLNSLSYWSAQEAKPRSSAAAVKSESLVSPSSGLSCTKHNYEVHVFSSTPLIIYIEDFVSQQEADHLIAVSNDRWQESTVYNAGVETKDESVRKSEKALIERDDVVQCIEQRALDFQGWPENTYIERLWTQRYNVSGHYAHHFDWASASKVSRRSSTFMVYLHADCEGGGTEFPRLEAKSGEHWCRFLECEESSEPRKGVIFKAKKGAAVFWENFDANGRGYKETLHAGMPVRRGSKIGLNIWSWYQAE